ncbi:MAG: alpha/beta hydrolase, partial [Methylobacteriaceae bacterium]|nr:alpha/beta hydrolase [Methylobacteriaceae bacterium]
PHLGLAHSMGGCIALTGAIEGWLPVSRLVAVAPMLGLSMVKQEAVAKAAARTLTLLGFRSRFVPGGEARSISVLPFEGNRLCADPRRYARNAAIAAALEGDAIGAPTIGWLDAAYRAMARFRRPGAAAGIRMPVQIIAPSEDPICSTPTIRLFADSLPPGSLTLIPGAQHEILMETDAIRARFWAAFDRFVDEPSRRGSSSAVQEVEHRAM